MRLDLTRCSEDLARDPTCGKTIETVKHQSNKAFLPIAANLLTFYQTGKFQISQTSSGKPFTPKMSVSFERRKEQNTHLPMLQKPGCFVLWTGALFRGSPAPPRCLAWNSPAELVMGTKAAELRLLWSPLSCPSVEDPLKHKQLVRAAERKRGQVQALQWLCLLLSALLLIPLLLSRPDVISRERTYTINPSPSSERLCI